MCPKAQAILKFSIIGICQNRRWERDSKKFKKDEEKVDVDQLLNGI